MLLTWQWSPNRTQTDCLCLQTSCLSLFLILFCYHTILMPDDHFHRGFFFFLIIWLITSCEGLIMDVSNYSSKSAILRWASNHWICNSDTSVCHLMVLCACHSWISMTTAIDFFKNCLQISILAHMCSRKYCFFNTLTLFNIKIFAMFHG